MSAINAVSGNISSPVEHGGSLARAERLFPHAPRPFVDLSTGINPHPYPLFDLPASALTRLPEPSRIEELCHVAARNYGAPSAKHVVAAPGTQILLPLVYGLSPPGRATVLGPTYMEHARAAALCGHDVANVAEPAALADADLAVVVNPNNPDGRVLGRIELLELASTLRVRGGLLVVDEAFMDVGPRQDSLTADVVPDNIVVLRSFGKFFGLAGTRLGFAIAAPSLVDRLAARLGPWAVAGPALEYGLAALADTAWQDATRRQLAAQAERLDHSLRRGGVAVSGGTSLFRHIRTDEASTLYAHLGQRGVILRAFEDRPNELRCGLPGTEEEWKRLDLAMSDWSADDRRKSA